MTQIIIFLFDWIKKIYELGSSINFEFFGNQVSVFSLIAGTSIIFLILRFLQLFVPTTSSGLANIGRGRNENRIDKMNEQKQLRSFDQQFNIQKNRIRPQIPNHGNIDVLARKYEVLGKIRKRERHE